METDAGTDINWHPEIPADELFCSAYKLVPWLNWDEWRSVRDSLFSNTPDSVSFAIRRINTWKSRGCLPVVIDVTSSIVEIQQMDPFFVDDNDTSRTIITSEQMLAMLYCMAIIRLVNCVVEKTRKGSRISISEAADAIGIPRTLIDIRHEGSHRSLPALPLVRDSSLKAIDWLRSYYWDPQSKQIPFQKNGISTIRKEIKSQVFHLFSCVKDKMKETKGTTNHEFVGGRSKLLSLMARKKNSGQKKVSRIVRRISQLYYSHFSEFLPVLLDFLLRAFESPDAENNQSLLDIWKASVLKLAAKEPEVIFMLLKSVIYKMELETKTKSSNDERLPSLFCWLVEMLKDVPHDTRNTLQIKEIVNKCFTVLLQGGSGIQNGAFSLAEIINTDASSLEKLKKLQTVKDVAESSSLVCIKNSNERAREAERKLESTLVGRKRGRGDAASRSGNWVVADWWRPCPIGMVPHEIGCGGGLADLRAEDDSQKKMKGELTVKKMEAVRVNDFEGFDVPESIEGCLIVNGMWQSVQGNFASFHSRLGLLV